MVIEKTLKQIADREGIASSEKAKLSRINEILWKEGIYDKIKWRLIQGYIDLGNSAAHGQFGMYTEDNVGDGRLDTEKLDDSIDSQFYLFSCDRCSKGGFGS